MERFYEKINDPNYHAATFFAVCRGKVNFVRYIRICYLLVRTFLTTKAHLKRRKFHVMNLMQIDQNINISSFALHLAQESSMFEAVVVLITNGTVFR